MTCDGLASRAGGVEILLAASCYGNQAPKAPKAPKASLTHFFSHFFYNVRSPNNQLMQLVFANNLSFITKLLKLEMLEADLT